MRWFKARVQESAAEVVAKMAADLLKRAEGQLPGEWRAHLGDRSPRGVDFDAPNPYVGDCALEGRQDANGQWWIKEPWVGWVPVERSTYINKEKP